MVYLLLFYGVVERWVNIRLFFFKEKLDENSSDNGDMSNEKEKYKVYNNYYYTWNLNLIFLNKIYLLKNLA